MKNIFKNLNLSVSLNLSLSLSLIAGVLLPLAFAPNGFYFFAVFSPVLLLFVWEKASPKTGFLTGFFYGLGYFGLGIYWIYLSIHDYGNTGCIAAFSLTFLFAAVLSLFPALTGYILAKFFPDTPYNSKIKYLFAFPSLWVLSEWARSWFLTGFPWLLLGYSQTNSPLSGFAPIIGVYGVSFLILFSAGLLFLLFKNNKKYNIIIYLLLIIIIWVSGIALKNIAWTKINSKPVTVSLVQGNIPILLKWSPGYALTSFKIYEKLTENSDRLLSGESESNAQKLIIWPETAVPFFLHTALPLLDKLNTDAQHHHTAMITGIPIMQNNLYYNGAVMLGQGHGYYLKRHLVPFGEYTPYQKWVGKILDFLHLPMSDFSQGPEKQGLLHAFNMNIAPLICYEVAYTRLLRTDLPKANLLVTLSNDSWFGNSSALGQHRQMAQFAALVTGRYMLAATNSGETVMINPQGKVLSALPINVSAVLTGKVYGMTGATPWVRIGNTVFILLFLGILILCVILNQFYENKSRRRRG